MSFSSNIEKLTVLIHNKRLCAICFCNVFLMQLLLLHWLVNKNVILIQYLITSYILFILRLVMSCIEVSYLWLRRNF
jgi:hypothetical protein